LLKDPTKGAGTKNQTETCRKFPPSEKESGCRDRAQIFMFTVQYMDFTGRIIAELAVKAKIAVKLRPQGRKKEFLQ
jgi:hypothetical protein